MHQPSQVWNSHTTKQATQAKACYCSVVWISFAECSPLQDCYHRWTERRSLSHRSLGEVHLKSCTCWPHTFFCSLEVQDVSAECNGAHEGWAPWSRAAMCPQEIEVLIYPHLNQRKRNFILVGLVHPLAVQSKGWYTNLQSANRLAPQGVRHHLWSDSGVAYVQFQHLSTNYRSCRIDHHNFNPT